MTRIHIPNGSWIRYRKQGRTLFGQKSESKPITWTTKPPAKGTVLYVLGWGNGQQSLLASKTVTQE
jgi:hypothetical protein